MFARLVGSLPVQITVVLGVACAATDACSACDCFCGTVEQSFDQADAVFFGEVVAEQLLDEPDPPFSIPVRRITFRVLQSWKGVVEPRVSVLMPPDSGVCGPDSVLWGDLFIVYATSDVDTGTLVSRGCDGTTQYPESPGCLGECDVAEFGRLGLEPLLEDGVDPCELSALCEPSDLCEPYSRTCGLSIFTFAATLVGFVGWSGGSGRHHRRKRKKLALCVSCGYDLRGSIDRCPECGMAIS